MARVTVEDCLKNVESRFHLVHLAVRRVLQLRSGNAPLVKAPKNKEVVVALREIAAGKVTLENIRQFEEVKPLPEALAAEKEEVTRTEVKEIMDAQAELGASLEYDDSADFEDLDETEQSED